ncbi:hypothetical protein DSECCO2_633560 [anaerobic digester metagenome]
MPHGFPYLLTEMGGERSHKPDPVVQHIVEQGFPASPLVPPDIIYEQEEGVLDSFPGLDGVKGSICFLYVVLHP